MTTVLETTRTRSSLAETDPHLVGGVFGLEVPQSIGAESRLHLDTGDALFLVNARSAIALVVDRVRPATVWLPSYLCQTLLDAVARAPRVEFYEVTHDLRPGTSEWVERVQGGDLVIVIDYFGFPFEAGWAEDARGRGAIVVRDAGQALLSAATSVTADFHVYSPRKFLGVPDGGILTAAIPFEGPQPQLEEAPVEWWLDGLAATVLRRSFDRHGGARDWFELFRRYEAAAPVGNYRMATSRGRSWMQRIAPALPRDGCATTASWQSCSGASPSSRIYPRGWFPLDFPCASLIATGCARRSSTTTSIRRFTGRCPRPCPRVSRRADGSPRTSSRSRATSATARRP